MATGPVRDAVRTYRTIIEAAADLIEQRGDAGVRIADVAESAKVSTGAIYHYFKTREHLVGLASIRALERIMLPHLEHLAELEQIAEGSFANFVEANRRYVELLHTPAARAGRLMRAQAVAFAVQDAEVREQLELLMRRYYEQAMVLARCSASCHWLRADLDLTAYCFAIDQLAFGMVSSDFEELPELRAHLRQIQLDLLLSFADPVLLAQYHEESTKAPGTTRRRAAAGR